MMYRCQRSCCTWFQPFECMCYMLQQQCFQQAAVVRACQHCSRAWSGGVLAAPWTLQQFLEPDDRASFCSPERTRALPPDDLAWIWRGSSSRTVLNNSEFNFKKVLYNGLQHKMKPQDVAWRYSTPQLVEMSPACYRAAISPTQAWFTHFTNLPGL